MRIINRLCGPCELIADSGNVNVGGPDKLHRHQERDDKHKPIFSDGALSTI